MFYISTSKWSTQAAIITMPALNGILVMAIKLWFIAVSATFNTQLNCYHRFVASLIASDNCIFCRTSS